MFSMVLVPYVLKLDRADQLDLFDQELGSLVVRFI